MKLRFPFHFLLAIILPSTVIGGTAYKWTDADGSVHYGDKKPSNVETVKIKIRSGNTSSPAPSDGAGNEPAAVVE